MAFQARWRELKKAGWTTKRPTGLSVDFTYLKPGNTKKDVRGVDFFVGEIELMAYLDEVDLGMCACLVRLRLFFTLCCVQLSLQRRNRRKRSNLQHAPPRRRSRQPKRQVSRKRSLR
ncbi:hypothetical protein AM587_10003970 [Phytophthora nicotianae]|uniref:Uncharacterized protein n=1 Tax=Phytophthora nicotianae TaxID=4792 RepID=A0A0W8CEX3_PHYNI|nr:hypothetical protein AM587_10003970 [Phytophthora nicotianae]